MWFSIVLIHSTFFVGHNPHRDHYPNLWILCFKINFVNFQVPITIVLSVFEVLNRENICRSLFEYGLSWTIGPGF